MSGFISCDTKCAAVLQTTIGCRIAVVMMQYSIMANSYWLLVEGIYLHNLLVITVFTERNYFKIYLCIGWGESVYKLNHCTFNSLCINGVELKQNESKRQLRSLSGTPLIFLVPWVTVKYLYENQE